MNKRDARPGKQKAFAMLTVKALVDDGEVWTIKGIASTPTTDRMGDKVNPLGAKFKTPMPLLLYHDSTLPVGQVTFAKPSKTGIPFEATLPKVQTAGVVQDRVNEAVDSIKHGLIAAVSIGFAPDYEEMEPISSSGGGGWIFNSWEWLELSLVTIPAQPEAVITGLKSFDQVLRAASGNAQGGRRPGVSGELARIFGGPSSTSRPKGTAMKTLQQAREERSNKVERMKELAELWKKEARDGTEDEDVEYDDLATEIKALDKDIRLLQLDSFTEVRGTSDAGGNASRGTRRERSGDGYIIVKGDLHSPDDKFKGQSFTRMAIAKALGKLQGVPPSMIAEHRWGKSNPLLVAVIKANEVAGGGTLSGDWGSQLVQADTRYQGDFIEMLYAATVFDKVPFREVPANVAIKGQTGGTTGYWTGEGKAIKPSGIVTSTVNLTDLEVGAIAVCTNKLLRESTPSAEALVQADLIKAISERIDQTVFSAIAASAGVSPAGLLNGVSATASTGEDITALSNDIAALYAPFIAANNADDLIIVTTPSVAKSISLMRSTLGVPLFPNLKSTGGELLGDTVYTGGNVPARAIILLKPSDIWEIGDTGVQVALSQDATIEQNSVPTGDTITPTAASATLESMFQTDSTAFKVTRFVNYQKRRTGVVQFIGDAAYGQSTT